MIDDAYVRYGPNPSSIPIAPKIIPNGITGIIKGKISIEPFKKVLNFEFIYLIFNRFQCFTKYDLSKPQSSYPFFTTLRYLSVGYVNLVLCFIE